MSIRIPESSFKLVNHKAEEKGEPNTRIFYKIADPSWNAMKFTFTNNASQALTLKGGTPVMVKTEGGASSLVIDFSSILPAEVVAQMVVADKYGKWSAQYFQSNEGKHPPTWAIAPKEDMTLEKGAAVEFSLENIVCDTVKPGNFQVNYVNFPDVTPRQFPYAYYVGILNPPVGEPLPVEYNYTGVQHLIGGQTFEETEFNGDVEEAPPPIDVVITYRGTSPIKNGVTLFLHNSNEKVAWGKTGTPPGNAVIFLTFMIGEDNDSITTSSLSQAMEVNIRGSKGSVWTGHNDPGSGQWEFRPKSDEILLGDEKLYMDVTGIITPTNVAANFISSIYVQYNNIGAYRDGILVYHAAKIVAEPGIPSFTIKPTEPDIKYRDNVRLSWRTFVAWRVVLEYNLRDDPKGRTYDSAKDEIPLDQLTEWSPSPIPSAHITSYVLTAYGAEEKPAARSSHQILVTYPAPAIDSFGVTAQLVVYGSKVTFTWNVPNPDVMTITLNGEPVTGTSIEKTITSTAVWTLAVTSFQVKPETKYAKIKVYVYKNTAPVAVGPAGSGDIWQSLPLSLANPNPATIYVSNTGSGKVRQLDAVTRGVIAEVDGNIMGLNPLTKRLFTTLVKQGGPSTLYMYDISSSIRLLTSVTLNSEPPYSIAVSPNGQWVVLLKQNLLTKVALYEVINSGTGLAYRQDFDVGTSPEIFWWKDSSIVYIGNFKSSNITVIDVPGRKVVTTITLATGQPTAFAEDRGFLYVACSANDKVAVINLSNNQVEKELTVGGRPFAFAKRTDEIFVANFYPGQNFISVIDTVNRTTKSDRIAVQKSPSALQFGEGKLLLVSNYCSKSLSVVDLSDTPYREIGVIDLGQSNGNPVDISVFNDTNERRYKNVFIAKEYFKNRIDCAGTMSDSQLNMSILSIQGFDDQGSTEDPKPDDPPKPDDKPKPPVPQPERTGCFGSILKIFGIKKRK